MGYGRKPLAKGMILYTALLLAVLFATPLTQAIYGYWRHRSFDMAIAYGASVTAGFVISSGAIAVNKGIALAAAAGMLAAKLTPWGWAAIIGVGIAL